MPGHHVAGCLMMFVFSAFTMAVGAKAESDSSGAAFFENRIRPIFVAHCYECHSSSAKKIKGELRLDHIKGWLKGGVSGPAIKPGKADESLLIKAVRYQDADTEMPPKKKLPDVMIADLEKWVAMGAPGGDEVAPSNAHSVRMDVAQAATFWSFQPLSEPRPPAVKDANWPAGAIDRFILSKLEHNGLHPAAAADKRTLIRRATFDLTGLPPTPEEVAAFVKDDSGQAFAKVVDRLLASPHYGERWGRHWLDVVRYADTAGETADYPVPHAWRYRNYVIDAFNSDMPYDQFLREQIAGDLLAAKLPADADPALYARLITATGYIAIARRFGFRIDHDHHLTLEDTIDTFGKSVLGLTIACARCHDHKYDPVSMQDFYALYGIFESTRYPFPGCEHTQRPRDMMALLPPKAMQEKIKPHQEALAAAEAEYQKAKAAVSATAGKVHELAVSQGTQLAKGGIDNGGTQAFAAGQTSPDSLGKVTVKKGAAIQLAINPRGHYGADSTQVEWVITELDGQKRQWNLATDLLSDLHQSGKGNLHRDSHGNEHVWCLIDQRKGGSFLDKYTEGVEDARGLNHWMGSGDGFPLVGVNTNDRPVKHSTATRPPRSVAVHPSNTDGGGVAILWVSPIDGQVNIAGKVIDIDTSSGDGIGWVLESLAAPQIGEALLAMRDAAPAVVEPKRKRDELAARVPTPDLAYAVTEGTIADAKLFKRGDHQKPGDPVGRRFLELFGGEPVTDGSGSGRLQLAETLTRDPSPRSGTDAGLSQQALVARVMVNRIWLHHFGNGLVRTPNDFGTRGEPPSHPELLDHLARQFIRSGWSIKAMHRAIMLTKTYQQASMSDGDSSNLSDPANTLLSHFPRRRLSAEEIRDSMLAVSGDLDRQPGEAHPFPPDNTWGFTQHTPFAAVYDHNKRSVYLMVQRSRRHPFLSLFDGADANASTGQRQATTVPTQSLYFMNDPFVHAKAASLAARIVAISEEPARFDRVYQLLYQRSPTQRDRKLATKLITDYQNALSSMPESERAKAAWAALIRVMMSANEFVYLD